MTRPTLTWHIIDEEATFEVCGIQVQSLPVHHGVYFSAPPSPPKSFRFGAAKTPPVKAQPEPLICLGFMFDESIVYMADVSEIPERTWKRLLRRGPQAQDHEASGSPQEIGESMSLPKANGTSKSSLSGPVSSHVPFTSMTSSPEVVPPRLPILVIDSLWPLRPHFSHFGLVQSLYAVDRLQPSITYLLGSTHPTTHFMWEEIGLSFRGLDGQREHPDAEVANGLVKRFWEHQEVGRGPGPKMRERGARIEPAWDGLVVEVGSDFGGAGWREVHGRGGTAGGWGI